MTDTTALVTNAPADLILVTPFPTDQNPAYVYLASLPGQTGQRSQAQIIRKLADMLGGTIETVNWPALRYQHTAALRTALLQDGHYSPASIRKFYAAIRGILRHARRLGLMSAEDAINASDLGRIEGETLPAGRYINDDEIALMFAACAQDEFPTSAARDAAILALLCQEGPRRQEIVSLDLADYDPATGQTTIRHGKRRKERISFLANRGKAAMDAWLEQRGKTTGPLFLAIRRNGQVRPRRRLSSQAIYGILDKRILEAGLARHLSPHDFRRTSISNQLGAGTDLTLVAQMYGHANVQTTARYDRRPDGQKRLAAEKLDVPYGIAQAAEAVKAVAEAAAAFAPITTGETS